MCCVFFPSLCLCRHTVCPSLSPASPRKPTFLDYTTRSPFPTDSGPGGGGKSGQEGRTAGVFAPAPPPHWEAMWHQRPLVPLPAHGASAGVWLSPLPLQAHGSQCFPTAPVPQAFPPLLSSHPCKSAPARGLRGHRLYPSSTFFAPPPHPLYSKGRSSLQERQTFRCTSWREVGTQGRSNLGQVGGVLCPLPGWDWGLEHSSHSASSPVGSLVYAHNPQQQPTTQAWGLQAAGRSFRLPALCSPGRCSLAKERQEGTRGHLLCAKSGRTSLAPTLCAGLEVRPPQ